MSLLNRREFIGGSLAVGLAAIAVPLAGETAPVSSGPKPRVTGIRRVIIDTDPGNDDALALLLALDAPSLQVEAITVCPGNLGPRYDQQVKNALYVLDLSGRGGQIAVHAGISRPLLNQTYPVATFIHGKFGLGGIETPQVRQTVDSEHAVDAILRIAKESPGEITILALGGLSNIAVALLREPSLAKDLNGIVFVGGSYHGTGSTPGYNILVDPEAAHIVFSSGVPLLLVTGDTIGRDSIMKKEDFDHVAAFNTARSAFFIASNTLRRTFEMSARHTTGSTNPDGLAVVIAAYPEVADTYQPLYAEIELEGRHTRGLLCYGMNRYTLDPTPPANMDMCIASSNAKFKEIVFRSLARA
jgi:purine nucleosidase